MQDLMKLREAAVKLDIPVLVEKIDQRIRHRRHQAITEVLGPVDVDMRTEEVSTQRPPTQDRLNRDDPLQASRRLPLPPWKRLSRRLDCSILGWRMFVHELIIATELEVSAFDFEVQNQAMVGRGSGVPLGEIRGSHSNQEHK